MGDAKKVSALLAESRALEREGRIGAAFRRAKQALSVSRAQEGAEAVARALLHLAYLHFRQGEYRRARRLACEAQKHAPPQNVIRVDALILLGLCAAEAEAPAEAEEFYRRAINLSRELDYPRGLARALHNLSATVYVPRGQFGPALAADEESLRLAREHALEDALWFPLATMGWVHWARGEREQARQMAAELHALALPGSLAEGFACCLRADLAQEGSNPGTAPPLYTRARSIAERVGDPGLGVLARLGLSRFYRQQGDYPAAREWAGDALALARRVGYRHLQGMALIARARAAWGDGDFRQAEADLRKAEKALVPVEAHYDLALAYLLLAALLRRSGHPQAETTWLEAVTRIVSGGYAFLLERERSLAFPLLADYLNAPEGGTAALSARLLEHLRRVPPPPLEVRTLGEFTVRQGNRLIVKRDWRQRRAGELFRLLLLAPGHTLGRGQALEALWPGKSPSAALALFHRATSALRRVLEPDLPDKFPSRYLVVEGGSISLKLPPGSQVDFEVFERRVQEGAWEAALEIYRGPLFPDDRYADWPLPRREILRDKAVQACLEAARQALRAGDPARALEVSRRALEMEPWQEQAVLLGMRARVALHDRVGAIRLYRRLEATLKEELGIEPQGELQAYYRSLLGGEAAGREPPA